jgi:hypothetical protein
MVDPIARATPSLEGISGKNDMVAITSGDTSNLEN